MEDEELVKMFNLTLKRKETILFFLIVVINGLIWIVSGIGLFYFHYHCVCTNRINKWFNSDVSS